MKSKSKIENTEFYRYLKSEFKITEELLEKLISNFQRKDYKKGEHILLKGETENTIKFVENGIVHQYRIKNKKLVTINIAIPGMIFNSFTSYALQEPSSQQQTTVNNVTIYSLTREAIESLLKTNHDFCYLYLKKQEQIHLERELRWRILMNKAASSRFDYFMKNDVKAEYYLKYAPNKLVASYLNISPETLSREKRIFYQNFKANS